MAIIVSTARPRLGDSFTTFSQLLGMPLHTDIAEGSVIRQYMSDLGLLTVLFSQGRSIGVRLPYPAAPRRWAAIRMLAAEFMPRQGAPARLLIGDRGWLLVTATCSPAAAELLASL